VDIFADVRRLGEAYASLARDGRSDAAGTLQEAVTVAEERYEALKSAVAYTEQHLRSIVEMKLKFDSNRDTTLTWLQGLDKELKTVEALSVSELQNCASLKVFFDVLPCSGHRDNYTVIHNYQTRLLKLV